MGEPASRPGPPPRLRPAGATALILEVDGDPGPWYAELCRRRDAGDLDVVEIVPAARTVLLDGVPDLDATVRLLTTARADPGRADRDGVVPPGPPAPGPPAPGPAAHDPAAHDPAGHDPAGHDPTARDPALLIPTVYDGPDLADVAARWGVSPEAAVKLHTSVDFRVAFCGFAPGFAYLTGLPPELHVPRHPEPRARVPVGSVALAGEYSAVYPSASPGGWRLLGRTDLVLFDLAADPPAALTPGARVRFTAR